MLSSDGWSYLIAFLERTTRKQACYEQPVRECIKARKS
jgi:hypothetical protein